MHDEDNEAVIRAMRRQSSRLVQSVFAALAMLALGLGLAVHHYPDAFALFEESPEAVAHSFLVMGLCYAATMLIWEHLYEPQE